MSATWEGGFVAEGCASVTAGVILIHASCGIVKNVHVTT